MDAAALLNFALVPVLALAAAAFALARPHRAAPSLLAIFLAWLAFRSLAGGLSTLVADAGDRAVWAAVASDANLVAFAVFLGFGWLYPTRLSLRSIHGAFYALVALTCLALLAAWLVARPLGSAAPWISDRLSDSFALGIPFAGVSCLWRARSLDARARRATALIIPAILTHPFSLGGSIATLQLPTGTGWAAPIGALAAIIAGIAWGSYFALGLAVAGLANGLLHLAVGPDVPTFAIVVALRAVVPLYASDRYEAFGIAIPSRGLTRALAVSVLAGWFLMLNVVAIVVANGDPLGTAIGVFAGLVMGIVGAFYILPRDDPLRRGRLRDRAGGPKPAPGAPGGMDRYRRLRALGEGGAGQASLYHDEKLDREVVIKRVPGGASGPALREARAIARVRHRAVIAVYDAEAQGGDGFIVMEHARGGSLRGLLARQGALPIAQARKVMLDALDGLAACHDAGIVHGDVKPENLLLSDDGSVKIADFGSARPPASTTLVPGGGTLRYLAPEQIRGEPASPRSDVYAAGVVLHEILTGAWYLAGANEDPILIMARIAREEPILKFPEGARSLEPIVRRALEKDPMRRYAHAGEMADELRRLG